MNSKNPVSISFRALILFGTAVAFLFVGLKIYALKDQVVRLSEKQVFLVFKNDSLQRVIDVINYEIDSINKNYDFVSTGFKERAAKDETGVTAGKNKVMSAADKNIVTDSPEFTAPRFPENQFYTVKKGDCLYNIAKEVYKNAIKYNIIFDANKPMLKDPDLIYPGQILIIPPLDKYSKLNI